MKLLMDQWREPAMMLVRSCDIIPDTSNRSYTGLSVEHVHFLAANIQANGFRTRKRGPKPGHAHDIPVLVRGALDSPLAVESMQIWRDTVANEPCFPPITISEQAPLWFTSLGNGHFTQALNCFRHSVVSTFNGAPIASADQQLAQALQVSKNY